MCCKLLRRKEHLSSAKSLCFFCKDAAPAYKRQLSLAPASISRSLPPSLSTSDPTALLQNMVSSALGRSDEQLLCAAFLSNCWCVCLFLSVCLEGRACGRSGGSMRLGSSWRWQLSGAMRLALRWCRLCRPHRGHQLRAAGGGGGGLRELWSYARLLLRSLYFNSLSNTDTLLDCAFEPVYWVVDNVTRWFGVVRMCGGSAGSSSSSSSSSPDSLVFSLSQVFVTLVILLTTSVVVIIYLFVLPTIFNTYPVHWVAWHLCCGHWLLVMLVFHYYKATTTSPGRPPKVLQPFHWTNKDSSNAPVGILIHSLIITATRWRSG